MKKNFSFSKEARIRKSKEFKLCYEQGKRIFSKRFILFVRERGGDNIGIRTGITVSKKIGKAVERNRLKRLIREFMRLNRYVVNRDLDIVIVPKRGIDVKTLQYRDVEAELYPILIRLAEKEKN